MIDNTWAVPSEDPHDRDAAIDRFAAACVRRSRASHGKQVARLAGRIFDQIAERFRTEPGRSVALGSGGAAARCRLSDQLRSAPQAQLSSDSQQPPGGHSEPRELELIANVARYHRGARPKQQARQFPPVAGRRSPPRSAAGGDFAAGRRFGPQPFGAGSRRGRRADGDDRLVMEVVAARIPTSISGAPQAGEDVRE